MFRLARTLRQLHQRQKRFLQNILRLAVAQAQRAAIKNQFRRLRLIKRLAPDKLFSASHGFTG